MKVPRMAAHTRPLPGMSVRETAHAMGTPKSVPSTPDGDAEQQRVAERLEIAPAPVGDRVVGEGEAASVAALEARPEQPRERVDHEDEQHHDEHRPQEDREVEVAPARAVRGAGGGLGNRHRAQIPNVSRNCSLTSGMPFSISS